MNEANHRFGVIELRRYAMRPGMRETLIELFEREFIETQEACGMVPIGHYRDLDDPDSFVWFRGFEDMETRRAALEAFYLQSDAWLANRNAANATMIDSDNVLLLRNAQLHSGFDLRGLVRDGIDVSDSRLVAASIAMLDAPASEDFVRSVEDRISKLRECADRIAYFVTDRTPNDFPRLPVREGEWAVVVVGSCANSRAVDQWRRVLGDGWETLRLAPALRSLFR